MFQLGQDLGTISFHPIPFLGSGFSQRCEVEHEQKVVAEVVDGPKRPLEMAQGAEQQPRLDNLHRLSCAISPRPEVHAKNLSNPPFQLHICLGRHSLLLLPRHWCDGSRHTEGLAQPVTVKKSLSSGSGFSR